MMKRRASSRQPADCSLLALAAVLLASLLPAATAAGARGIQSITGISGSGTPSDPYVVPTELPWTSSTLSFTEATDDVINMDCNDDDGGLWDGDFGIMFRWTAPASGEVQLSTCGATEWDTTMAVLTGAASAGGGLPEAPSCVKGGDDGCGDALPGPTLMKLDAVQGTTYWIAVGELNFVYEATFQLTISWTNPPNFSPPPPPLETDEPSSLASAAQTTMLGLSYTLVRGKFDGTFPNHQSLKVLERGVLTRLGAGYSCNPLLPATAIQTCLSSKYKNQLAMRATGSLRVLPADAKHSVQLLLKATGWARVTLGGTTASISGATSTQTLSVSLAAGDHPIVVEWMQVSGTAKLQMLMRTAAVIVWSSPRFVTG
ncbi:bacterial pre-peptidase c-terminal domain containing [Chlorella sorokiniana]|uniref:Bacterial pre-peptidase c-terminal domain containing n=1 Tax=Chlorella sorokiniana TaxID=3076 RepID=A0A2P6TQT3_CHLSO|nr:bacterial pre-peptidase c-terminal domain containing [Chlorella sorokiniana]|eukprot:PRW56432.1 bacterial pre-peptidase c-terminal domain containing [Chlorella sorokiniana]